MKPSALLQMTWPAAWLVGAAASLLIIGGVMTLSADAHLRADAEHLSLQYAHFVGSSTPQLQAVFDGQPVPEATLEQLKRLRKVGDVFRFKLFDRQGRERLDSTVLDNLPSSVTHTPEQLGSHAGGNSHVRELVLAGKNHIALETNSGHEPVEVYSEAYVPIMQGGQLAGVVEVYVDHTSRRGHLRQSLAANALAVGAALALLCGLAIAHLKARRKAQQQADDRVRYLSQHDALSGALNRSSFNAALEQARLRHEAGGGGFAVLCLNLDRFKDVNDSMGHAAGDEVLRQVSARLREVVRNGDVVARLGADEFAVLQHGVDGPAAVRKLAQRIVDDLAVPYATLGQAVTCSVSVGAALYGVDAVRLPDLLHKADLALYRAKSTGRGRFSFYDAELDKQLQRRRDLAADLRQAITAQTLHLNYQPLYAADGRTLTGYEALLRWAHPTRGSIPPMEFIALAEENGLIEALGQWVLHQACTDAASWPEPLSVAVNLSPAQFRNPALLGEVSATLAATGLSARRLELEITESLLMTNTERVISTLQQFSAMGVRIAMDDFGTGYSSLSYLWQFPFNKVKIDRAFTQAMVTDDKVNLIVHSIVSLAHALGMRVNAEGVETMEQMQALQQHGCDELQGFLLGRPAPLGALAHQQPVRATSQNAAAALVEA